MQVCYKQKTTFSNNRILYIRTVGQKHFKKVISRMNLVF